MAVTEISVAMLVALRALGARDLEFVSLLVEAEIERRKSPKDSRTNGKPKRAIRRVKTDKSGPDAKILRTGEFHSGAVASVPGEDTA
jgi:hypothetical protein